jgi:hypothetical protein
MSLVPVSARTKGVTFSQLRHPNIVAVLLALIPSLIKLLYYPHNIGSDDAYIHLQIARNIFSGHSWGLNPNMPVNMSSSPAFTLLLTLVSALTVHTIPVMQILSCLVSTIGLLLLYFTVRSETSSATIGLASEAAAALSCDLWRWNGTLMEASLAFFILALLLFLARGSRITLWRQLGAGVVAGFAILLRPELSLAAALYAVVSLFRTEPRKRPASLLVLFAGSATLVLPWIFFARRNFNSWLPTTFYAKSVPHLILWNPYLLKQMLQLTGESFLWPALTMVWLICLLASRRSKLLWRSYLLPVGLLSSVIGFYYLKTPGLESPGRYLLPFLPCAALIFGLILRDSASNIGHRRLLTIVSTAIALQCATSLAINQIYLAPALQRFESEYADTMRTAANFMAERICSPEETVLAELDVGVLAYAANGRFRIYDGGGLASPELAHLPPAEQVQRVQPAYLIESQGDQAAEWDGKSGGRVHSIWSRRYKQHSISQSIPYLFANIYSTSLGHEPGTKTDSHCHTF